MSLASETNFLPEIVDKVFLTLPSSGTALMQGDEQQMSLDNQEEKGFSVSTHAARGEPFQAMVGRVQGATAFHGIVIGDYFIADITPSSVSKNEDAAELQFVETENSSVLGNKEASEELIADQIRTLVESGSVVEARKYLSSVNQKSPRLDNWRKVLAKPNVKVCDLATGQNQEKNISWIRQNSKHYKGQWVALKQGKLMGSNEGRFALHQTLKKNGTLNGSTFIWIDEE